MRLTLEKKDNINDEDDLNNEDKSQNGDSSSKNKITNTDWFKYPDKDKTVLSKYI